MLVSCAVVDVTCQHNFHFIYLWSTDALQRDIHILKGFCVEYAHFCIHDSIAITLHVVWVFLYTTLLTGACPEYRRGL